MVKTPTISSRELTLTFNPWTASAIVIAIILLCPILSVFYAAAGDSGGLWQHLSQTVLPRYLFNTLILMFGVSCVSLLFGVPTAWVITRYTFPGKKILEWMLLLPAAVPTYLIAYTYTDFLEYAGPVQKLLRELFGWQNTSDYWFPEIRSIVGASVVLGAVLYPYVYVMARTAFLQTPATMFELGKLAKRNLLFSIGLPLARPAIVAGLALVLMETISEFGAVEYFAIETLTMGIFNVWLGMNNLPAAAQIASASTLFILVLLGLELSARSRKLFSHSGRSIVPLSSVKPSNLKALMCIIGCLTPITIGFLTPVGVLISFVIEGYSSEINNQILTASINSISLAVIVALTVIFTAAFIVLVSQYEGGLLIRRLAAISSIGYAFPGVILAIGVITIGGKIDDGIAILTAKLFGLSYSGWLTGGIGIIVIACVVRFQAVGYGAITTGLDRLPNNMMDASRVLGKNVHQSLRQVILPLLRLPLLAGGILVFVDVMKELPMTLLLRPFNYDTLATYLYQFAKDELLEEAALPALMIVGVGILPVILMNSVLRKFSQQTTDGKA